MPASSGWGLTSGCSKLQRLEFLSSAVVICESLGLQALGKVSLWAGDGKRSSSYSVVYIPSQAVETLR